MREVDLLIGTREEFENYYYNDLKVIPFETRNKDVKIDLSPSYFETSEENCLKNQLDKIESNNGFGMVYFIGNSKSDEENTVKMTMLSRFIWIQKGKSNE